MAPGANPIKKVLEKIYVQCVCKLQRFIIENYFSN
jgi:hypothetical protein